MLIESALTAEASALDIASALEHFLSEGITDKHFHVVARTSDGEIQEFWVRPIATQDFMPLASGGQLIKCIADTGIRLDMLLPRPENRESCSVLLFTEKIERS